MKYNRESFLKQPKSILVMWDIDSYLCMVLNGFE